MIGACLTLLLGACLRLLAGHDGAGFSLMFQTWGLSEPQLETFMLGRRDSMLNGSFFVFGHGQRRFLPGARSKIVLDSCLIRKVTQKLIRPVALLILHSRVRF